MAVGKRCKLTNKAPNIEKIKGKSNKNEKNKNFFQKPIDKRFQG